MSFAMLRLQERVAWAQTFWDEGKPDEAEDALRRALHDTAPDFRAERSMAEARRAGAVMDAAVADWRERYAS